jgi:hypothetical protein
LDRKISYRIHLSKGASRAFSNGVKRRYEGILQKFLTIPVMGEGKIMLKKVVCGVLGLVFCYVCVAQTTESITLTTYYPSPYGSYNQLDVQRSVTFNPLDKDTLAAPQQGELVYNSPDDAFYYYNGSDWVKQGGGTGAVISLKCKWYWSESCSPQGSPACAPPALPRWLDRPWHRLRSYGHN